MTALPPRHRHSNHDHDQADLQDQAEDRRQSAEPAEHSATEQHAEQAGAEEARGKAAEHAAAGAVEEAAGRAARRSRGVADGVMVRLKGCAVPGAVEVLGGAENVRAPRDPELMPPPIRASADGTANSIGTASDRTTAIAWTMPRARCVNFMSISLKSPAGGSAPNMGSAA